MAVSSSTSSSSARRRAALIAGFLLGLVALDQLVGAGLAALHGRVRTGDAAGAVNNVLAHKQAELLVFGNSRAAHHVDPTILESRLGLRGFNAGADGQNLYYVRMLQALLYERGAAPRVVILHIDPIDLFALDPSKSWVMAPFYGESDAVDDLLRETVPFSWIKLRIKSYRYNSMLLPMLASIATRAKPSDTGFRHKAGDLTGEEPVALPRTNFTRLGKAELERRERAASRLLESFVSDARSHGAFVVFVRGPFYAALPRHALDLRAERLLRALVERLDVLLVEYDAAADPRFGDGAYFRDRDHLNSRGATLLSELLAGRISTALEPTPSAVAP